MSSIFSSTSNPFATSVGQLIDTSTDPNNQEDNVEIFFEICDMINAKEDNAKDAMRAIRKKLHIVSGKNWTVVMKLLKLIEITTDNCNRKFQVQVANKEFLNELKTMIGPKLQPPIIIQEKVLSLIEKWAQTFKHDHDFKAIEAFYLECKNKGIIFPVNDPANNNIQLSEDLRKIPTNQTAALPQAQMLQPQSLKTIVPGSAAAVRLNEDQIAKLKSELDIVDNNILVMNEVLTEHQPNQSKNPKKSNVTDDISLLGELFLTTSEMQKRVTQLIGNISNENIIGDLLRINDDLNNVFVRYERFQKGSNFKPSEASASAVNIESKKTPVVEEKSLIDFGGDEATSTTDINIDFLNKNSKTTTNVKPQLSNKNSDEDQFLDDENEIAEMENWLKNQELDNAKNTNQN